MNNVELASSVFTDKNGLTLTYSLIAVMDGCLGQHHFNEQWKASDHQGGITIQKPQEGWSNDQHFEPLQYSLAQLTKDYHKQGRGNPSKDAYSSLQGQLERDLECFEVYLQARIVIPSEGGDQEIELLDQCLISSDYHHADFNYDSGAALRAMIAEHGDNDQLFKKAVTTQKEMIKKLRKLLQS